MWPLDGLRHCSRSRKSADELPISKNRHPAKIERPLPGFMFLGTSALLCFVKDKGQSTMKCVFCQLCVFYTRQGFISVLSHPAHWPINSQSANHDN